MLHILISGGIYHDFQANSELLAHEFRALGLETVVFDDPEAALAALATYPRCDLLTINALRFTMQQHDKYAPLRDQWAFELSAAGCAALAGYVRGGGGLLGLHTAGICFDGWEEWPRILGASWIWGRSFHERVGEVEVQGTEAADPITAGLPGFQVHDEVYRDLYISPDAHALLRARCRGEQQYHPVLWAHRYGAGRVIYDALGHGPESLGEATHLEVLRRAAAWLVGLPHHGNGQGAGHGHAYA